jgi:hypothetical protein
MNTTREELLQALEDGYRRGMVWREPWRADDTVCVADSGGVTWYALAVLPEDVADPAFRERLLELADRHMPAPDGRRCVLEAFPAEECRHEFEALLRELRLDERVAVYSLVA